MSPYRIRISVFEDGERFPFLIDSEQVPVPMLFPTLYSITIRRSANLSMKTIERDLRALMCLYSWAKYNNIDIEKRMSEGKYLSLVEIESLTRILRLKYSFYVEQESRKLENQSNVVNFTPNLALKPDYSDKISPKVATVSISSIASYLDWLGSYYMHHGRISKDQFGFLSVSKEKMVKALQARIPKSKARNVALQREGISKDELKYLLEVLQPLHNLNPWIEKPVRIRNQLIFLLLNFLGIRRGELLGIKISDINFQNHTILIRRRADDPSDIRVDQPNSKTRDRKLVIQPQLAKNIFEYVFHVRTNVPGARLHEFLFVTHTKGPHQGKPLSSVAFTKIFNDIRTKIPGAPKSLSAHVLRHTWNDMFSELMDSRKDVSEEREKQLRSYYMGWSPTSDTASTYTRRYVRELAKRISADLHAALNEKT